MTEPNAAGAAVSAPEDVYTDKKRALFDKLYAFLNPKQREAVYAVNGPLLVLAGAGSGKTTVLVNRIAHLIHFGNAYEDASVPAGAEKYLPVMDSLLESGTKDEISEFLRAAAVSPARPWNILCITFTNKAAGEFKQRLETMLGPAAKDIWAGTFHSVCVRILRQSIHHIGYDNAFTIYDTDDAKRLVTQLMKEANIDTETLPVKSVLAAISRAKENHVLPARYLAELGAHDVREKHIGEIYDAYQKKLKQLSALDFDDLILYTSVLFDTCPEVLEKYRRQFDYILVDEYQDTNPSQSALVEKLAGSKRNVCVVGDDDQSIYSFRGATIRNILEFDHVFPDARIVKLEQNYRSTQNILSAANAVIENNEGRKGKNLWTESEDGEKILVKEVYSQNEEAMFIADRIMERVAQGEKLSSFAVLYRTNAQSGALESAFTKARIPYRVFGGIRFYERKEVKDIVAYLSLIANHADDMRLMRIINVPKRAIGTSTVEHVARIAAEEGAPMLEIARNASDYPALQRVSFKLEQFYALIADLAEFAAEHSLSALVEEVVARTGYLAMLRDSPEDRDKEEIVQEFVSSAKLFEETSESPGLSAFLEDIALVSDTDNYDADAEAVSMMTVHSAKGLEFPVVYVVGMEEGIFPGSSAQYDQEELEEERRLCYVAMTRAKEKLYMTCASQRMLFGRTSVSEPSRFLEEVPSENADWVGRQAQGASGFGDTSFDEGSSYSTRGYGSYGQGAARYDSVMQRRPKSQASQKLAAQKPAAFAPLLQLSSGDQIHHKTFGDGLVISVTPMGGDALLEVAFDTVGTKKLMLKTAGVHITKL